MSKTSFSILSIKPKTLETEGTISTFFIKTLHYDSFCVPDVVYLHDLQMSIVKHFPLVQSNLNLQMKEKLNFKRYSNISGMYETCEIRPHTHYVSLFEMLASNRPFT